MASSSPHPLSPGKLLRHTALLEGASFLILLFVAMPLKYLAGQPLAVKITGMIHGILFVLLCAALLRVHFAARWPLRRSGLVFLSSLIPFGPFLLDRRMKEWENDGTPDSSH